MGTPIVLGVTENEEMLSSNTLTGIAPEIDEVLEDTYGCIVYQEQVMELVQVAFGMSLGEADIVRRAIGKKDPVLMQQMIDKMKASPKRLEGLSDYDTERILKTISVCSSYLFNKSHSAAYALTAYQTAYLKANFPLEFYCALLNSNIDQEKMSIYIGEAKRYGITILFPEISKSKLKWTIDKDKPLALRMGFSSIRSVGNVDIQGTCVTTKEEFLQWVRDNINLNKQVLTNLVCAGCFPLSPVWCIECIEWAKQYIPREKQIHEKMEFCKDNEVRRKQWEEKLKYIPKPPDYFDTPLRRVRELQIKAIGISNISLFSLYDDTICQHTRNNKMVMVNDVLSFVSHKGTRFVKVIGETKKGMATFLISCDTDKDFEDGKKIKKGDMIIVRCGYNRGGDDETYFCNEFIMAKEKSFTN